MRLPTLSLLLVAACGPKAPPPAPVSSAPPVASPALDTPFTAQQIRDAMPVGTHVRLLTTVSGMSPTVADWTVLAADDEGCTIRFVIEDPEGTVLGGPDERSSTWTELQEHARFDASLTTVEDATITVPAGTFDTRQYTVRTTNEDGLPVVRRFHFAPALPGPPVLLVEHGGGEKLMEMMMLERK